MAVPQREGWDLLPEIQSRNGNIHIIYTTNSRTTIMHAVFDEHAIIGSRPEL
jgi:hypothetical protein